MKKSLMLFVACLFAQQVTFAGTAVLTAVGIGNSGLTPIIAASNDGAGSVWTMQTVPGLPTSTNIFNGTSCSGSGASAVCTAVGGVGSTGPLLAVTTNGATSWSLPPVTGMSATTIFSATSCTDSGLTGVCTAVGQDFISRQPLLAVSTNGGNTWSMQPVVGAPTQGVFRGTSCTGSGTTAICTAVGQDQTSTAALVAVSTNGGATWAMQAVPFPATANVFATSCTGTGASAICTITGVDTATNAPLIAVSTNGTATWSVPSITGLPAAAGLPSTSCTGTGATAVCTASGSTSSSPQVPVLVASNDGGVTWTMQSFAGMPARGYLARTSCTGNGPTAICIAAGMDQTTNLPFLAVTTNGANTWVPKTVGPFTPTTGFNGASCSGVGATAICTATGRYFSGTAAPFVEISTDGGNSWNLQTITGVPASGIFGATAGTA